MNTISSTAVSELSDTIHLIKHLPGSDSEHCGQHDTLLIGQTSFYSMNAKLEQTMEMQSYNANIDKRIQILDVIFLSKIKKFVLLLSDATLMMLPLVSNSLSSSAKSSEGNTVKLGNSLTPLKIYSCMGVIAAVVCSDGRILVINFSLFDVSSTDKLNIVPVEAGNGEVLRCIDSCSDHSDTIAMVVSGNNSKLTFQCWSIAGIVASVKDQKSAFINILDASCLSASTPLCLAGKQESIVQLCALQNFNSFALTFAIDEDIPTAAYSAHGAKLSKRKRSKSMDINSVIPQSLSRTGRILKIDRNGDILFDRSLPFYPKDVIFCNESLWISSEDHSKGLQQMQLSVYDIRYGTLVNSCASTELVSSKWVVDYVHNETASHLMMLTKSVGAGTTVSIANVSNVAPTNVSLLSCLGKGLTSASSGVGATSVDYDGTCQIVSVAQGCVFSGMDESLQRQLEVFMAKSKVATSVSQDGSELVENVNNPSDAIETFLKRFNFVGNDLSLLSPSDWKILENLLACGVVSIHTNSNLVSQVVGGGRLDLLTSVAHNISDLTEEIAVKLLIIAGSTPNDILANFIMVKGSICMLTKAASKSVENTKESKKKFKPLDLLTFVRIICKSFICRKISWSSVFLSDALQMMSPKLGTLLLRIFLSFTRIINDRACDEEIHWRLGTFDDKCIRQACDWIEALLDAHFAGTAINASYDQNIRASLLLGYEGAISSLNHSVGIECLSGIYSHITRASRRSEVNSKANHQGPPVGIYRRESITF